MLTTDYRRMFAAFAAGVMVAVLVVAGGSAAADDPRLDFARELLRRTGSEKEVALQVDAALGNPEAFSIHPQEKGTTIRGGGAAGVLYGVQQWTSRPTSLATGKIQKPDFQIRGTALFPMTDYAAGAGRFTRLTPEVLPWFYDRELLTRYFDYLLANRFNTIFLWSGHLFPSIVELPDYPDATDLSKEQLLRNQEQFKWFTDQCAKRNISVLLHFYNIHIPKALADSRKIPMQYREPNDFAKQYTLYALGRFLEEFDSVGLYVCPGELLRTEYQPEWIRDVIFAAAKKSGKNPLIVVRDWILDIEHFKRVCQGQYDNLYTELKHNVEMIVSPVPVERHLLWKNVGKKHIVNLHEVADVKPFRWGSPKFIHEMVREWKKIGLDGAEVYPMVSWRWPYSLDKLEAHQTAYWPSGKKLLTLERDAIWLEAIGRYLWKANRDPQAEQSYWTGRLAEKFGNPEAGRLLLQWYDTSGPVLPGLQNLTHVRNMNSYPTVVGHEQNIDWIFLGRHPKESAKLYPPRPVDTYFFERYKQRYNLPALEDRITMPMEQYVAKSADGEKVAGTMTPDNVVDLLVEMAQESVGIAREVQQAATKNQEEAARFVTDSQALLLIAMAWRHKVLATIEKQLLLRTGDPSHEKALMQHMEDSVKVYEKLVGLTEKTYINATDIGMERRWTWPGGLEAFQADLEAQRKFLAER